MITTDKTLSDFLDDKYEVYKVNTKNIFSPLANKYAQFLFPYDGNYVLYFAPEGEDFLFSDVAPFQGQYQHYQLQILFPQEVVAKQLSNTLGYYFPQFNGKNWPIEAVYNWIHSLFSPKISAGFLVFNGYKPQYVVSYDIVDILIQSTNTVFISEDSIATEDSNDFGVAQIIEALDNYFEYEKYEEKLVFHSRRNFQFNLPSYQDLKTQLQNFDPSTQERLQIIIDNLEELRATGQLFLALPLLDKFLREQAIRDTKVLSRLEITEGYQILLPQFNIEVQLSHLTKAFYILFYQHPWGIPLSELPKYREGLKQLYLAISNQNDYNKMMKSIDDLLNSPANIATHISRIKDRFCELLYPEIALHYCIIPDAEYKEMRYIPWCRENTDLQPF